MVVWEAHIVGAESAREWDRWCAATRATGTPTPQYAAHPTRGVGANHLAAAHGDLRGGP